MSNMIQQTEEICREVSVEKINLSRKEAAAQIGVSLPTLQRLTRMAGGVPHFRIGSRLLYPRAGLIEWSEKQGAERAIL